MDEEKPIILTAQGSFSAGGKTLKAEGTYDPSHALDPAGQTKHVDHAYVFYQAPKDARPNALVFLHGAGQSGAAWETTPDGREGFQTIFLRKGYKVFLMDQPGRGRAASVLTSASVEPKPDEALWLDIFRFGHYPERFPGVQIPEGEEAADQLWRRVTPDTRTFDAELVSDTLSAAIDRAGPSVIVTHSQGAGAGWCAAMKNDNVRGIIALEPGVGFLFPDDDVPDPLISTSPFGALKAEGVDPRDFHKLTEIPILMIFGDNIPDDMTRWGGEDNWRVRRMEAENMAEEINRQGGDARVIRLPDVGIHGNTHFLFEDLNNREIADLMEDWMIEEELDR